MRLLFLLLVAHFVCDYPLQGDFLARGKNLSAPLPGVPWYQCMLAHAMIHAGGVYLVTGSGVWAFCELLAHCMIDSSKCHGHISFNQDQLLHVGCKVIYVFQIARGIY